MMEIQRVLEKMKSQIQKGEKCTRGSKNLRKKTMAENDAIDVDLEKMSLEEWFDFLDIHLPKQIIDVTEIMILNMKQKAEKFHALMFQQKNSNSKAEQLLPVFQVQTEQMHRVLLERIEIAL